MDQRRAVREERGFGGASLDCQQQEAGQWYWSKHDYSRNPDAWTIITVANYEICPIQQLGHEFLKNSLIMAMHLLISCRFIAPFDCAPTATKNSGQRFSPSDR